MIELNHLNFSYSGAPILNDLFLSVPDGSFIGITGENGSGKTTLLRLLAGLEKPQSGILTITKGQKVSYLRQTTPGEEGNFPASVFEIVCLGNVTGQTLFISRKTKEIVDQTLREVGLGGKENEMFSTLSGGQKQRVKLAKALVKDPDILLLDEPTTGLDEKGRNDFFDLLKNLKAIGKTLVVVSHRNEDFALADKVYVLEKGFLREQVKNV